LDEVTHSDREEATLAAGERLAAALRGGSVVALAGDLGAGKTVFARGVARGLGITEPVTSPTFAIVQEYRGRHWRLCHIDLYRLRGAADALSFGLADYLADDQAVVLIEWPDRIAGLLAGRPGLVRVELRHCPGGREIRCRAESGG